MGFRGRLGLFVSLTVLVALLVACGGSGPPSTSVPPGQTLAPVATEAPLPSPTLVVLVPDGERILGDVRYLADTIGPRPAGSEREKEAADFIADRLRSFGYEVSFQEFSVGTESARDSSLAVKSPSPRTLATLPLERSGTATVQGRLVAAGKGSASDFPATARGSVVLIERGDLFFNDKVANAQAAGARGVIIFNNDVGIFYGSLGQQASIPAVSISQAEGRTLLDSLQNGAVDVELSVGALGQGVSRNVIAKPPGRNCETVSGGHYDSVPLAPGASDNGSGTATVMEIAGIVARGGHMAGNCFVLFGGEELGLLGSKAFVNSLDTAARERLKAMFNYDMVGVGDETWLLIGNAGLQQRALGLISPLGIQAVRGSLGKNTSSDHASFVNAGLPALMLYRTTDNLLHTPRDVSPRVRADLLEQAARFGVAMLESFNGAPN